MDTELAEHYDHANRLEAETSARKSRKEHERRRFRSGGGHPLLATAMKQALRYIQVLHGVLIPTLAVLFLIGKPHITLAQNYTYTDLFDFTNATANGSQPYAGVTLDALGNLFGTTVYGGAYPGTFGSGFGTVFKVSAGGGFTKLYDFPFFTFGDQGNGHYCPDGAYPITGVTLDPYGNLFGTTYYDPYYSVANQGAVYKISATGVFTKLVGFSGTNGGHPSGVTLDPYGSLFGTTNSGGANGVGTVFRLIPQVDGSYLYSDLLDFNGTNGSSPSQSATLALDANGNVFGTTTSGGANNLGTVFKISPDGTYTKLLDFNGANGSNPYGGVTLDSSGNLYGTTKSGGGGQGNLGTVFKLTPDGTLTTLIDFNLWGNGANGNNPSSNLTLDASGNLYGTAGTVFEISPDGTYTNLLGVSGNFVGSNISLSIDASGNLYGTTIQGGTNGIGNVFKLLAPSAPVYTVSGQVTLNGTGLSGVVMSAGTGLSAITDANGNYTLSNVLAGTYNLTATLSNYTFTPATKSVTIPNANLTSINFTAALALYTYTNLFDFTNATANGVYPYAGVTLDSFGNLYGTAIEGGAYPGTSGSGFGTVFKVSSSGVFTKLYDFPFFTFGDEGNGHYCPDGAYPITSVTLDPYGNLFGTTQDDPYNPGANQGAVYKISATGVFTKLLGFSGADGSYPSGVTLDPFGSLFGTTNSGGANGLGTVFQLIPQVDGSYLYADLLDFNGINGSNPSQSATLALDANGNVYGTAPSGGANGLGTVYKISNTGTYTKLFDFNGVNGSSPAGGVTLDSNGNLYGTTSSGGGGQGNLGTVFKLTPDGTFTTLIDFNLWGPMCQHNMRQLTTVEIPFL